MPFERPSGFYTTRFTNELGENSFQLLKKFLFDDSSGRTDVIFFGERNVYFEDTERATDLVGGLADGIAKACLSDNLTPPRTLYGTPIFWGSHSNSPGTGFSVINGNWSDDAAGNPEGLGRTLTGTRYVFDSYLYGKDSDPGGVALPARDYLLSNLNSVYSTVNFALQILTLTGFVYTPLFSTTPQSPTFDNLAVNVGPIAYPWFLNSRHISLMLEDPDGFYPSPVFVGKANAQGRITEWLVDSTTTNLLRASNIPEEQKFPSVNTGTVVSSLDSRFSLDDNNNIQFRYHIADLLIPVLQNKGWTVCTSGCIGTEDVYFRPNTVDNFSAWVFNRFLPLSYGGLGHEFLFTTEAASNRFDTIRNGIVATEHLTSFANLYNGELDRGLFSCIHYTRIPVAGWSIGGRETTLNYEFNAGFQNAQFTCPLHKVNLASTNTASLFWWDESKDEACNTFYKNKAIVCNTNLGLFLDSVSYSPTLSISTLDNGLNSLYSISNFQYKLKYYSIQNSANKVIPNGSLGIVASKINRGDWVNFFEEEEVFNPLVVLPTPAPSHNIKTYTLNLAANTSNKFALSFTGFNNSPHRALGDVNVIHQWGENPNDLHGIAFSHGHMSEDFRSGDVAYVFNGSTGFRSMAVELFNTIKIRQASNPGHGKNDKYKIIIAVNTGRFDTANPGDGYIGGWAQVYLAAFKTYLSDAYLRAGIKDTEVVYLFVGPLPSGNVDYQTSQSPNYDASEPLGNFIKTKFIFTDIPNAANPVGGLLSANAPFQPGVEDEEFYIPNAVHVNLRETQEFTQLYTALNTEVNRGIFFLSQGEDPPQTHTPSVEGFLLIGELLLDAINGNTSASYFAPPWVKDYGTYLNYTDDPVSGSPFQFLTPTADPELLGTYLSDYYALVAQGNAQATQTLAYFKHKILQ